MNHTELLDFAKKLISTALIEQGYAASDFQGDEGTHNFIDAATDINGFISTLLMASDRISCSLRGSRMWPLAYVMSNDSVDGLGVKHLNQVAPSDLESYSKFEVIDVQAEAGFAYLVVSEAVHQVCRMESGSPTYTPLNRLVLDDEGSDLGDNLIPFESADAIVGQQFMLMLQENRELIQALDMNYDASLERRGLHE